MLLGLEPREYLNLVERQKLYTESGLPFCSSVQHVDFRVKHVLHS